MDQLVQLVVQRTGISEDQARQAIEVVVGYAKERLPAPVAGQVDALLGNPATANNAQQALDALGGMFGKK